ncbi:MAG: MgtC/SapB family protein [Candidatus Harrisonbacteria bacterium]|nr:MgtC/SapB family protein [Candidatus Harrisonbacteria bacterium]
MEFFSPENLELFGQLALATLLGALIGVERELARKTAGMRTFALVALGSALFTTLSQIAASSFIGTPYDPSRIASQVVVGIGFIGAGIIIFNQQKLRGLTTAAGLWVTAAIGMAVGYRFYQIAIFATFIAVFVLFFLWFIEHKLVRKFTSFEHAEDED